MIVTVTSDLSTHSNGQKTASFDIVFKTICWDIELPEPTIASYNQIYYLYQAQSIDFTFDTSQVDDDTCGTYSYSFVQTNGSNLPVDSVYTVSSTSVDGTPTDRTVWLGEWTLKVVVSLGGFGSTES